MNAQRTPLLQLAEEDPQYELYYADPVEYDGQHLTLKIVHRQRVYTMQLVAPHGMQNYSTIRWAIPDYGAVHWAIGRPELALRSHVVATWLVEADWGLSEQQGDTTRSLYKAHAGIGVYRVLQDDGTPRSGEVSPLRLHYQEAGISLGRVYRRYGGETWNNPCIEELSARDVTLLGTAYDEVSGTLHVGVRVGDDFTRFTHMSTCTSPAVRVYREHTYRISHQRIPGGLTTVREATSTNECVMDFTRPLFPYICTPDRIIEYWSPSYGLLPVYDGTAYFIVRERELPAVETVDQTPRRTQWYMLSSTGQQWDIHWPASPWPIRWLRWSYSPMSVSEDGAWILTASDASELREPATTYREIGIRVFHLGWDGGLEDYSDTPTDLAAGPPYARVDIAAHLTHKLWHVLRWDDRITQRYKAVNLPTGRRHSRATRLIQRAYKLLPPHYDGQDGPQVVGAWQLVRR